MTNHVKLEYPLPDFIHFLNVSEWCGVKIREIIDFIGIVPNTINLYIDIYIYIYILVYLL